MAMRTTFARNGAGWAFGPTRSLDEFAQDVMRNEYDSATGALLGALIREQSTVYIDEMSNNRTANVSVESTTEIEPPIAGFEPLKCTNTDSDTARLFVVDTDPGYSEVRPYSQCYIVAAGTPGRSLWLETNGSMYPSNSYLDLDTGVLTGSGTDQLQVTQLGDWWLLSRVASYGTNRSIQFMVLVDSATHNRAPQGDYYYTLPMQRGENTTAPRYVADPAFINQSVTIAPDFLDAPGGQNSYGPGLHTWRNAVRMSSDPGEPTIIGSAEHRIYASNGRLQLDGPGELIQPEGEHAPGDYVPFIWNVQFPGAAPDFALGREYGDANWWNGHLVDTVPFPRKLTTAEINAWVAR